MPYPLALRVCHKEEVEIFLRTTLKGLKHKIIRRPVFELLEEHGLSLADRNLILRRDAYKHVICLGNTGKAVLALCIGQHDLNAIRNDDPGNRFAVGIGYPTLDFRREHLGCKGGKT